MAIKIILLSFIAGVILLLIFDSHPSNGDFGICAMQMRNNYNRVFDYTMGRNWSADRKCITTREQIVLDSQCIDSVYSERITGRAVFWISPSRVKINETIRMHNKPCGSEYDVDLYEINFIGR